MTEQVTHDHASPGSELGTGAVSQAIARKSVEAAIAAIEIYNKPSFSYREEAFSLLMVNAWELLLKAKWISDHEERTESVYEMTAMEDGVRKPKRGRSGNPLSHGVAYIAARLAEDPNSGMERPCYGNILALLEIRDCAAHFIVKDLHLGRRVLEIGTASLRNFLLLATEWFQLDLSEYNFFLMPISFYHGFETVAPVSRHHYAAHVQKLLDYLDGIESENENSPGRHHVALRLETKLSRGKDPCAVAIRWTNDPDAPAMAIREEDVLKNYPMTYRDLADSLKHRYADFLENREFHRIRRGLERETKFVIVRYLHPGNPKSAKQRFYNANILLEFDRHYVRRHR